MSMFLPEDSSPSTSIASSLGESSASTPSPVVTTGDIALMQRVLAAAANSPNLIPDEFMAYVFDFIQTQRLNVPIGQVFGFSPYKNQISEALTTAQTTADIFVVEQASIATSEATTSSTYGDIATAGPEVTGVPDGSYVIFFGAAITTTNDANTGMVSVSVNGAAASDSDAAVGNFVGTGTPTFSVARAAVKTLSAGTNTIELKYRSSAAGDTSTFKNRWLVALRYAT